MLDHQLVASLSEQLLPSNYVKLCDSDGKIITGETLLIAFLLHMQKSKCADSRKIREEN